jgi:hypothetical protein
VFPGEVELTGLPGTLALEGRERIAGLIGVVRRRLERGERALQRGRALLAGSARSCARARRIPAGSPCTNAVSPYLFDRG